MKKPQILMNMFLIVWKILKALFWYPLVALCVFILICFVGLIWFWAKAFEDKDAALWS